MAFHLARSLLAVLNVQAEAFVVILVVSPVWGFVRSSVCEVEKRAAQPLRSSRQHKVVKVRSFMLVALSPDVSRSQNRNLQR